MGHLYSDIVVKGSKAELKLKRLLIDTGATYTVLPKGVIERIGAWGPLAETKIELGNGKKVKAKSYAVSIKMKNVSAPAIIITFKGCKTVIGVETLESVGLRLNPTTGKLGFTRPKGMAYFYLCHQS